MNKTVKISVVVLILLLSALFLWSQLSMKPYSTDLTLIGQGKPTLVIVYESTGLRGMEAMEAVQSIRTALEPETKFLVADMGTPDGRAFAQQYEVFDGVVLLFDREGEPRRISMLPQPLSELKAEIRSLL